MKKQLRFLYRYIIVSRRWRRWLNNQTVIIVISSIAFLSVLIFSPVSARELPRRLNAPGADARGFVGNVLAVNSAASQQEAVPQQVGVPQQAETPAPLQDAKATPTPTPMPPEFYENADQTVGITLTGTLLVLIVVFGVLMFMPQDIEKQEGK